MRLRSSLSFAAAMLAIGGAASAQGFSVTITVDENGNGTFTNTSGFMSTLPSYLQNDPGPGGLNNVLTYSLLNPPGLTDGDVILVDPDNTPSDIVRFNSTEITPDGSTGALVFYSNPLDGLDSLGDTPSSPGVLYPNSLFLPEVLIGGGNNGAIYTPTVGEPGFVAGAGGPVTYVLISDGTAVPEPGAYALLGSLGLTGAAFLRRHRAR